MVGNPLNVKVLREIKNNFKTYLSVILIATLAVTLFTGIFANYKNFDDRLQYIYQEANMCEGIIMTNMHDEKIKEYLDEKEVYYEERMYFIGTSGSHNVYLTTFDKNSTLNLPYQTSLSESISSSMVLVEENFLNRADLKIGDSFDVDLPCLQTRISLKIDGTIVHPESLENSNYNPSFLYVGEEALKQSIYISMNASFPYEQVGQMLSTAYNQFLLSDASILDEVKETFGNDDNFRYALKRSELPSNMTIDADVDQAKQLIYIFPVIFYLVAILIILTSISQLIHREGKNIGILKALGFSKYEILFHYMKIFIVLSVIGSLLGSILGPIIVPNVMGNKYNILYQLPKISLPFFRWEYLISVAILIGITALMSLIACFESLRQVPASCLRGENSVKMNLTILHRIKFFDKIPLPILMAFRNMKRKWSRTIMVLLGVLGCSALLVCGFGIEDTINYGLDLELEDLIPYDVSLTYIEQTSKLDELYKIENIKVIDEYAKYSVNVEANQLISSYVFVLPEEASVFQVKYTSESCILSRRVAEEIGASVGTEIHFVYASKRYTATVTEIVDFCISQGVFISKNYFEDLPFTPTGAWITSTDASHNLEIKNQAVEITGVISAQTITEMREHADGVISSIKVMTWTIKIFAILLAIVVLYNLALLNFKERTKDIATLKVLGFSRFEVASSFIIEILFLTFIGALIGLAFGRPLLIAVLSINENPLISYIYHIYPFSYCITVVITCGSSLLINLFFAFLTNRVEMVESLKSVE